jgi:hypothetical protein
MPQFSIFSGDARGSAESMGNFPRGASRNSKFLGRSEFCRDGLARTWPRTAEAKGAGGGRRTWDGVEARSPSSGRSIVRTPLETPVSTLLTALDASSSPSEPGRYRSCLGSSRGVDGAEKAETSHLTRTFGLSESSDERLSIWQTSWAVSTFAPVVGAPSARAARA